MMLIKGINYRLPIQDFGGVEGVGGNPYLFSY